MEKTSKKKERICYVCRTKMQVGDLLRIARIDGKFLIDPKGNAGGRGCHICPACTEKAIKTRALNKSYKANVGDEIYIALAKYAAERYTGKRES